MPSARPLTLPRTEVTPDHIMQIGMGFWASKALLSAVELGVFTYLAGGPKTGPEIERVLGLHPRGTHDLLDTLVALDLLARDGDGVAGQYRNTAETAEFLDRNSPQYIGGILEMANARLYRFWADRRRRSRRASRRTRSSTPAGRCSTSSMLIRRGSSNSSRPWPASRRQGSQLLPRSSIFHPTARWLTSAARAGNSPALSQAGTRISPAAHVICPS